MSPIIELLLVLYKLALFVGQLRSTLLGLALEGISSTDKFRIQIDESLGELLLTSHTSRFCVAQQLNVQLGQLRDLRAATLPSPQRDEGQSDPLFSRCVAG